MANESQKTFWKALGPGLLWAGAAIGVSHLVQSTRAGAEFGFSLLIVLLAANFFKYPTFQFGPRYAAATGTSMLEGYRRQGKWALILYAVLTLGTMFTVQGVVTLVTGALLAALLHWTEPMAGFYPTVWLSALLTIVCAALLMVGRYKWLDKIVKVVVLVLTLTTLAATALALPSINWSRMQFLPSADFLTDRRKILFMVAFVGWMPSAFDISIWHSLWTLARRRETGYAPQVRESLIDFNVGYLGTSLLALCFLILGASVMYNSGTKFSDNPAAFAGQVIHLFTAHLGSWSKPIIATAAFTVMFSTTLTVVDGFPRAIAALIARFREPEVPNQPTAGSLKVYWTVLLILAIGSNMVTWHAVGGGKAFKSLVDLATSLSFLTAPALAWLNHRAMQGKEVTGPGRLSPLMVAFSWSTITFSAIFAGYELYTLFAR